MRALLCYYMQCVIITTTLARKVARPSTPRHRPHRTHYPCHGGNIGNTTRPRTQVQAHTRALVAHTHTRTHSQHVLLRQTATYLNMCHAMVVQVRAGGEAFPTHLALVRLLAGMYAPMGVQRAGRAETLSAHQTHVRFFTCEPHRKTSKN